MAASTIAAENLPKFDRPPVGEVALSVVFERISGFGALQAARLWERAFSSALPRIEEHPPVAIPQEPSGDETSTSTTSVEIEIVEGVAPSRFFFVNEEGTSLVQVQPDFFATNWRRRSNHPYPAYTTVRSSFELNYDAFQQFLATEKLGPPRLIQWEVTYTNHLQRLDSSQGRIDVRDVLSVLSHEYAPIDGASISDVVLQVQHKLQAPTGERAGSLQIRLNPAVRRNDQAPFLLLSLTARGRCIGADKEGLLAGLDFGHSVVVRSFAHVTRHAFHELWARTA